MRRGSAHRSAAVGFQFWGFHQQLFNPSKHALGLHLNMFENEPGSVPCGSYRGPTSFLITAARQRAGLDGLELVVCTEFFGAVAHVRTRN